MGMQGDRMKVKAGYTVKCALYLHFIDEIRISKRKMKIAMLCFTFVSFYFDLFWVFFMLEFITEN